MSLVRRLVGVAAALQLSLGCGGPREDPIKREDASPISEEVRPNIVLINLDDADCDLFSDDILERYLPTFGRLARKGMSFSNCHVTTPLCGPSRAALLRGQYAHRVGIKTNRASSPLNNGFSGGYHLFEARGYSDDHIGSWMQQAGYRTMMIGKYAHGHFSPLEVKGWDDFYLSRGGKYFGAYHQTNRSESGSPFLPPDEEAYRTDQEADQAVRFVEDHAHRPSPHETHQPFFIYIMPLAPHRPAAEGAMLPDHLAGLGSELRIASTPDLNEADVSDKPPHLQLPLLSQTQMEDQHTQFRQRVLSLIAVDRLLERLSAVLAQNGLLDNTFILLTSDHGYQLGHNRVDAKNTPFHRTTHVPLYVAGPGITPGGRSDHLVSLIDLAPTFLALAGQNEAPVGFDGQSLLPLMQHPSSTAPDSFRTALLIESWETKKLNGQPIPTTFSTRRTASTIYTEWANGAREFYDLGDDPYQLENRYNSLSEGEQATLARALHELKQGDMAPIVTVSTQQRHANTLALQGCAEDVDAVTGVELSLTHAEAAPITRDATLLNTGGLLTAWEASIDLTDIPPEDHTIVTLRARNGAGAYSAPTYLEVEPGAGSVSSR